jgi:hypothetical protein
MNGRGWTWRVKSDRGSAAGVMAWMAGSSPAMTAECVARIPLSQGRKEPARLIIPTMERSLAHHLCRSGAGEARTRNPSRTRRNPPPLTPVEVPALRCRSGRNDTTDDRHAPDGAGLDE